MKYIWYGRWFPEELALLLLTIGGVLLILQLKKLSITFLLLGLGTVIMPPLYSALKPLFFDFILQFYNVLRYEMMDASILVKVGMAFAILLFLPFLAIRIFLGKEVMNHIIATLVVDFIRGIFKAPFVLFKKAKK